MRQKRDNFIESAEARMNRTLKELQLIGNPSNRSTYEFTDADVWKMFSALHKAMDNVKARFGGGEFGGGEFHL